MGKLIGFLTILIFVDLLFVLTGQAGVFSPTSIIFNAILDPSAIQSSKFWLAVLGLFGIAGIAAVSSVQSGVVFRATDTILFVGMATTLGTIGLDFVSIYSILAQHSKILATVIMGPMIVIFIFTVGEWLRGRD